MEKERLEKGLPAFLAENPVRMAKYLGEEVGFAKAVGMKIIEVREGYCQGMIPIENRHLNPLHTVHGGVFFSLADTV